jgi:hypothetical protein
MERNMAKAEYRITENRDGGSPFSAWLGATWLGDYQTWKAAEARCNQDRGALKRKNCEAEAHAQRVLDHCSKLLGI